MAKNSIADFGLYRQVDADTRNALADTIAGLDLDNYKDVAKASRAVLEGLLRGNIPTGVSAEAREHLTMLLSALASEAKKEAGGYGPGAQILVNVMQEARNVKPVSGQFTRKPKLLSDPAAKPFGEFEDLETEPALFVEAGE